MGEPTWRSYRRKPVVLQATRWVPGVKIEGVTEHVMFDEDNRAVWAGRITTLEGELTLAPGTWVVRGVGGEIYPVAPDPFEQLYEPAGEVSESGAVFGKPSVADLVEPTRAKNQRVSREVDEGGKAS